MMWHTGAKCAQNCSEMCDYRHTHTHKHIIHAPTTCGNGKCLWLEMVTQIHKHTRRLTSSRLKLKRISCVCFFVRECVWVMRRDGVVIVIIVVAVVVVVIIDISLSSHCINV